MEVSVNDVIAKYMEIGIFISINQRLDAETISIIAEEFGITSENVDDHLNSNNHEIHEITKRSPNIGIWQKCKKS